jgi:signal transduction histidine kinase
VASQRLYEQLVTPSLPAAAEVDVEVLFRAFCGNVLGAGVGFLVPLGPLAPLVGSALTYPAGKEPVTMPAEVTAQFSSPQVACLPLDPDQHEGIRWAVPLWSERGMIGVLLLGDKRDGSLYTQEEIEFARTSGERLMDTLASTEMARRLMFLQRQQLAQGQVLDQRARRVLHDEVLPLLHTAMLTLSGSGADRTAAPKSAEEILATAHGQLSDLLRDMPSTAAPQVSRLGLVGALRQVVDDELGNAFDGTTWQSEPEAELQARTLPPLTAEALYYAAREAIRNAALHGRGGDAGLPLHLHVEVAWRDGLEILVEDDGVGVRPPSASAGQGLALHSTLMAVVRGTLAVESLPGRSTRVLLTLPRGSWQNDTAG